MSFLTDLVLWFTLKATNVYIRSSLKVYESVCLYFQVKIFLDKIVWEVKQIWENVLKN